MKYKPEYDRNNKDMFYYYTNAVGSTGSPLKISGVSKYTTLEISPLEVSPLKLSII